MGDSTSSNKKKKKRSSTRKEPKRPKCFSDFDKISKALLTTGYSSARKITITTRGNNGTVITSTYSDHGRISPVAVAGKYGNATIGLEVDRNSRISATLNFSRNIFSSTKIAASAKLANYNSSMLPSANLSATLNISSIAIGMKATYKSSSSQFAAYDAGISVTKPICDASIILADKGDLIRASFVHYFDQGRKIAAVTEISRRFSKKENNLTVGCSCTVDHHITIKAKLDNHGKLNALLMHKFKPKSYLTISSEFNTISLDKHPKIGLALALSL